MFGSNCHQGLSPYGKMEPPKKPWEKVGGRPASDVPDPDPPASVEASLATALGVVERGFPRADQDPFIQAGPEAQ